MTEIYSCSDGNKQETVLYKTISKYRKNKILNTALRKLIKPFTVVWLKFASYTPVNCFHFSGFVLVVPTVTFLQQVSGIAIRGKTIQGYFSIKDTIVILIQYIKIRQTNNFNLYFNFKV